jgi:hypothetical protein
MISFLEITGKMDAVAPIGSLRELAARHRWEGAAPPAEISLARLAARHLDPATTTHRLLWYNTYLIHGFEVKLCNAVILARLVEKAGLDPRKLVLDLALDPLEVVERLDITDSQLVKGLGISLDQLKDKFESVVNDIVEFLTFGTVSVSDILDKISPRDIVERFSPSVEDLLDKLGIDPIEILFHFCELALAFIAKQLKIPSLTSSFYTTGDAPGRPERAKEIGSMLGAQYDVAALCEVFEPDRQDDVQKQAGASGRALGVAKGTQAEGDLAGSGLMSVAFEGRLVSSQRKEFGYQGDPLRDADAWSRKGMVRIVLDLGHGWRVELYSTHLFNGGGILEFDPADPYEVTAAAFFPELTPAQRLEIQLQQVDELVGYIKDTHQADHVAMLVGDFNINANDPAQYAELMKRVSSVELVDLWPYWHQHAGPSLKKPKPRGDSTHPESVCDTAVAAYCAEPNQPDTSERIDFIFVQRPKAEHPFVLDMTRVRRRPFSRGGSASSHLSDHLGLDIKLIASPKTHIPA